MNRRPGWRRAGLRNVSEASKDRETSRPGASPTRTRLHLRTPPGWVHAPFYAPQVHSWSYFLSGSAYEGLGRIRQQYADALARKDREMLPYPSMLNLFITVFGERTRKEERVGVPVLDTGERRPHHLHKPDPS